MGARPTYPFGEPDWDTVTRWLHLEEADDGPVWMLNLMRYRPVAVYADGRETSITGREADDLYSPVGPLEAIGATVPLLADVTAQAGAEQFVLVIDPLIWDLAGSVVARRGAG